MAKSIISSSYSPPSPSSSPSTSKSKSNPKSKPQIKPSSPSSYPSTHPYQILSTLIFPNQPQKHHTIGRGTPGNGITPWMNSGDLRILGGRKGKIDQVDPESLTSFC